MTRGKSMTKSNQKATVLGDETHTFTNPISGMEETKIGGMFAIDNIDNRIDLEDQRNVPRYDDDDTINYIAKDSSGKTAKGTYNLDKLLNELKSIVGDSDRVSYDKPTQTIHIQGRFLVMESINIHQPPQNIIRVARNSMRIKGNGATERMQGLYGGVYG